MNAGSLATLVQPDLRLVERVLYGVPLKGFNAEQRSLVSVAPALHPLRGVYGYSVVVRGASNESSAQFTATLVNGEFQLLAGRPATFDAYGMPRRASLSKFTTVRRCADHLNQAVRRAVKEASASWKARTQ